MATLNDYDNGIKDAVIVHLFTEADGKGRRYKYCNGEEDKDEYARQDAKQLTFCEACRLLSLKAMRSK